MKKSTYEEVSDFIKFLINLSGIYNVDADGYIVSKHEEDKRIKLKIGNEEKNIIIFKKTIEDNDAIIVNPLNESIGLESEDKKWLYSILSLGLFYRIRVMLKFIVETALNEDEELKVESAQFLSKMGVSGDIDEKMMNEIEILTKDGIRFINVFYRKKFKEGRFRCIVFEKEREEFNIRKKTWKILDKIFCSMFGVDEKLSLDEKEVFIRENYSYKTNSITCPKLKALLMVYNKIYQAINEYLEIINYQDDDFVVDLDELGYHINHLDNYYERVKWFVQVSAPEEEEEFNPIKQENSFLPSTNTASSSDNFQPTTPDGIPLVVKKGPAGTNFPMDRFAAPGMGGFNQGFGSGGFVNMNQGGGFIGGGGFNNMNPPFGSGYL